MGRRRVMMMLFGLSDLARNYIIRVEADGGTIESVSCIDGATPSITQ